MAGRGARTRALAVLALLVLVLRQLVQSGQLLKRFDAGPGSHGPPTNRTSDKITLFVHFHKAAGSSVVSAFLETKRPWQGHHNGNPWGVHDGRPYLVEFWRHDAGEFLRFLTDARLGGVEFIAMEWNFFENFTPEHLEHVSVVTCVREPYDRFVSNLFHAEFDPGAPSRFVAANLTKEVGRVIDGRYALDPNFPVNFNKPNYYVAFMNGQATDHASSDKLDRTHLDIAKERLALFDAVFVLERPETFQRWLPEMQNLPRKNRGKARKMGEMPEIAQTREYSVLERTETVQRRRPEMQNLPRKSRGKARKMGKMPEIALTRKQFYLDNALDQEFYQFALNLSLSRI